MGIVQKQKGELVSDLISRQAAIDAIESHLRTAEEPYCLHDTDKIMNHAFEVAASCVYNLPSAQPEIIRCKDCKHKPHPSDDYDYDNDDCGFEIIFPDYRCPCQCEDEYYNRIPDDDWYCGNAERRTDG